MPEGLVDDLQHGDEITALAAVRKVLASELLRAEGAAAAPLSREFRAVLVELRRLGAGKTESTLDEIAARRARRRAAGPAAAEDPPRAAGGGDGGSGGA